MAYHLRKNRNRNNAVKRALGSVVGEQFISEMVYDLRLHRARQDYLIKLYPTLKIARQVAKEKREELSKIIARAKQTDDVEKQRSLLIKARELYMDIDEIREMVEYLSG